jgi:hypothetical protein
MKGRHKWTVWRTPWPEPHLWLIAVFVALSVVNVALAVAESAPWHAVTAAACALMAAALWSAYRPGSGD